MAQRFTGTVLPQIAVGAVAAIIALFSAIFAFGDRFVSERAFTEFKTAAQQDLNERIEDIQRELTIFRDEQVKRLPRAEFELYLRERDKMLPRDEFDRYIAERKHFEELAIMNPPASKNYVDAQDTKATERINDLQKRVDTLYQLYRDITIISHDKRPGP